MKKPTTALPSSDKVGLKKHKDLLPALPAKDPAPGPASDPAPGPAKEPASPDLNLETHALLEKLKASGFLKNIFCNSFDFILVRTKRSRLAPDERAMLEDPLNQIEVKLLEMLPDVIRKQVDKGGPVIDLTVAVFLILWAKNEEIKAAAAAKKDNLAPGPELPKEPVKPAPGPVKPAPFNPTDPIPEDPKIKANVI